MKELILTSVRELTNTDLNKEVEGIRTELIKKDKSNFAIAKHVTSIIDKELWTDDFENQNDLADYLGVSKSQISLMKVVTELKQAINKKSYTGELKAIYNAFTMSKLFELRPLNKLTDEENDILSILDDFGAYCEFHELDLTIMSNADLRQSVKSYVSQFKETEAGTETEAETEAGTEAEAEVETETTATTSDFAVDIDIKGDRHHIESKDFLEELTKLMQKYDLI